MIRCHPVTAVAVFVTLLPLCGCNTPSGSEAGFKTVRLSYDYDAHNQRSRQWDTQTAALDKCHQGGFTQAQPAQAAQTMCVEGSGDGCLRYHAVQVYDCIGMGWQDN